MQALRNDEARIINVFNTIKGQLPAAVDTAAIEIKKQMTPQNAAALAKFLVGVAVKVLV